MRPFSRFRPLSYSSVDIDSNGDSCGNLPEIMLPGLDCVNDDDQEKSLIPVFKVFERSTRSYDDAVAEEHQRRPCAPPLPYRLTFKGITIRRRYFPRSMRSIKYMLGFASANVEIEVSFFAGSQNFRLTCNNKLITMGTLGLFFTEDGLPITSMPPVTVWSTQFKVILESTSASALVRVEISQYHNVTIFIDDFPVTTLRRSSTLIRGSPAPNPYKEPSMPRSTLLRVRPKCL